MEKRNISINYADPSGLGQFGLAIVTLVAGMSKLGILENTGLVVPWAIFLGSIPQIIAGYVDLKKENVFGGTVFSAYGFFWAAMAMSWMLQGGLFGLDFAYDSATYTYAFVGFLIFSVFMTIGSMETYKVLFYIFVFIDFLFLFLVLYGFTHVHVFGTLAGVSELLVSALGFYGMAGNVLNRMFGREFLPMGKPFGIFK